jgi:hypothetical protein
MYESHLGQKHYSGRLQARTIIDTSKPEICAVMKKYEEKQHVTTLGYWEDTKYCPETAERMFLHRHATIP